MEHTYTHINVISYVANTHDLTSLSPSCRLNHADKCQYFCGSAKCESYKSWDQNVHVHGFTSRWSAKLYKYSSCISAGMGSISTVQRIFNMWNCQNAYSQDAAIGLSDERTCKSETCTRLVLHIMLLWKRKYAALCSIFLEKLQ